MNMSTPSKGVRLPQYGGEGTESYKGNQSNMSLQQHGGEGKSLGKRDGFKLLTMTGDYCGPGRYLK